MRAIVISDIHGNLSALEAVLETIPRTSSPVLFLGDLVGYYPDALSCLELLDTLSLVGVRGNHDQRYLDCIGKGVLPDPGYESTAGRALRQAVVAADSSLTTFLQDLPETRRLTLDDRTVRMIHGSPQDPLHGRIYPDSELSSTLAGIDEDILLLGHTHHAIVHRAEGKLFVNPGSVGQGRDVRGQASYAVVDSDQLTAEIRRIPYNASSMVERYLEQNIGPKSVIEAIQP